MKPEAQIVYLMANMKYWYLLANPDLKQKCGMDVKFAYSDNKEIHKMSWSQIDVIDCDKEDKNYLINMAKKFGAISRHSSTNFDKTWDGNKYMYIIKNFITYIRCELLNLEFKLKYKMRKLKWKV